MSDVIEVRVAVTRYMTFRVEGAADAWAAIGAAERRVWEGENPDDESLPSLEVESVTVGGREIEFSDRIDWSGARDGGLLRKVNAARVGGKQVAENHDFETVVRLAEAAAVEGGDD